MSDLLLYIPNHGYSESNLLYVSWLNDNFYVRGIGSGSDSFKISTDDSDDNIVQFSETITEGFVRKIIISGVTTITGLEHLESEAVKVTSRGQVIASEVVSSGSITVAESIFTYAVGLNYNSTLQPMDLDIEETGLSTTKRINRVFVNLYRTIGGTVGPSLNEQESMQTGSSLFAGFKTIPIPGGYSRDTDITIKQTDPLPMTVLSIGYDLGASND